MIGPLFFKPIYQERVWGGRSLASDLGRQLPDAQVIGESWDIVDREEAQSVVVSGPFAGQSLRKIMEEKTEEIMGPHFAGQRAFPILVKWLDCQDRLSLQVHPPASIATSLKGEPKTENWYIVSANEDASLIVGLKNGVTREQFEKAIEEQTLESCVHRFGVKAGDSILVESGRIHAIDGGNLILEIQQNSDTTYRVYDWGRAGLDGVPRQLHVEESLQSIDFNDFEPSALKAKNGDQLLADCSEFRIQKYARGSGDEEMVFAEREQTRLISVVSGKMTVWDMAENENIAYKGDTFILPYGEMFRMTFEQNVVFLITDKFA